MARLGNMKVRIKSNTFKSFILLVFELDLG